ncbi:MAG: UDP-glucose 4-epimerase [Candidatus Aenigmarchaeota archaeon ex4484_52]|nr:MAG: UDP-glucose 4-epimerase [Candidatus Aenigmarchaeota archaeon ex4484_52]
MNIIITGGCGFIGSNLVRKLSKNKTNNIVVIDNLSSGKLDFIKEELKLPNVNFIKKDLLKDDLDECFCKAKQIWHLAANPDVKSSTIKRKDVFEQNVIVTNNVLEQAKKQKIEKFIFASTSTIYGIAKQMPTKEDYGPLKPISIYGATKLCSEAMICAYSSLYSFRSFIFRFANVVGLNSTHGVIYDFVTKLKKNPKELEILGDGNQIKSYIYCDDCIDAMILGVKKANNNVNIFNIGTENWTQTRKIADIISSLMNLKPKYIYAGGKQGWAGDVPKMMLDISKLKKLRWIPKYSSDDAVKIATEKLIKDC